MKFVLRKLRLEMEAGECFVGVTTNSNCEKLRLEIVILRAETGEMPVVERPAPWSKAARCIFEDEGAFTNPRPMVTQELLVVQVKS